MARPSASAVNDPGSVGGSGEGRQGSDLGFLSPRWESNPRRSHYECDPLPTEVHGRAGRPGRIEKQSSGPNPRLSPAGCEPDEQGLEKKRLVGVPDQRLRRSVDRRDCGAGRCNGPRRGARGRPVPVGPRHRGKTPAQLVRPQPPLLPLVPILQLLARRPLPGELGALLEGGHVRRLPCPECVEHLRPVDRRQQRSGVRAAVAPVPSRRLGTPSHRARRAATSGSPTRRRARSMRPPAARAASAAASGDAPSS